MSDKLKTTNQAREFFKKSGLSYMDIDISDIEKLTEFIKQELTIHNSSETRLKMTLSKKTKVNWIGGSFDYAFFFVNGPYFKKREAISFNSINSYIHSGNEPFIGFAGWASSCNVQPFINAFEKWVKYKIGK